MEPTSSIASALARIGAIAAPVGAVILIVSTLLHPVKADPDDALAAFAEYAADPLWVWSHLGQFVGVTGFSAMPMTIVMLATFMFLVWLLAAAVLMWRLAPSAKYKPGSQRREQAKARQDRPGAHLISSADPSGPDILDWASRP